MERCDFAIGCAVVFLIAWFVADSFFSWHSDMKWPTACKSVSIGVPTVCALILGVLVVKGLKFN
jgi:hypothetical protein